MQNAQQPNVQVRGRLLTGGGSIARIDEALQIDLNRTSTNVRPSEENTIILQYKNDQAFNQSGRIYLLYNEKATGKGNDYVKQFDPIGAPRIYAGAKTVREQRIQGGATKDANPTSLIPSGTRNDTRNMMTNIWNDFENYEAFSFTGLSIKEQSNIFVSLKTHADIGNIEGKDVKIKALLISGNQVDTTSIDLTVAKAHDPNKISVNEVRENFRRVENRFLTYKVQFQNDGDAPAKDVIVKIEIPEGLEIEQVEFMPREFKMKYIENKTVKKFDGNEASISYQIKNVEDGVEFTFRNVNLPGLKEKHIKKYKETTGSFKYKIKYRDKLKKEALKSRAHIVFVDFKPREAVTTSYTTTRFKPGLSIGPRIGVDYSDKQFGGFVGAIASPYKSERFYYQPEIYLKFVKCDSPSSDCAFSDFGSSVTLSDFYAFQDSIGMDYELRDSTITTFYGAGQDVDDYSFNLVPLQIRKDIGKWLSLGVGMETSFIYRRISYEETTNQTTYRLLFDDSIYDTTASPPSTQTNVVQGFQFDSALFADVTLGNAKGGGGVPAVSFRYYKELTGEDTRVLLPSKDRLQLALQWKF